MRTFKKTFLYFTLAFFVLVSAIPQKSTLTLACDDGGTAIYVKDMTAELLWSRTFDWNIAKSVTPNTWNLFKGDTGTSKYTVSVTKNQGIDMNTLHGNIVIFNALYAPTQGLKIDVTLSDPVSKATIAEIPVDISSHPVVAPNEIYSYAYNYSFLGIPLKEYEVTVKATIMNFTEKLDTPYGPVESRIVSSPLLPTLVNNEINVDDNGQSWTFSDTGSTSYTRTFSSSEVGTVNNTATIRETKKSASASVTINSYELNIAKTANPSFTRTYNWSIDKTGDKTTLNLQNGQSDAVNYNVALSATYTDSNWASSGIITINNPAPIDATINSISDIISPDIPVIIQNLTLPLTIPSKGNIELKYSTALPNSTTITNTVTAVQQNYAYNFDSTSAPNGTTNLTDSATINFSNAAMKEIDKTVSVTDDKYGSLGNVSYSDSINPFTYQLVIGTYMLSGTYTYTNTATFVTYDTKTTGSDSWVVTSYVNSGSGTRTIGYWKNHPANMTGLLPIYLGTNPGSKTITVSDSKKAVEILSMNVYGKQSNGITKLYAQLLAAKLNIRNGVDSSAISTLISQIDSFLTSHNYNDWQNLSDSQKDLVLDWMNTLDNYNNGLIGPGHALD